MHKTQALASLGQHRLMLPGWVKGALAANDRLKTCLTLLQAAAAHAAHPQREAPDLSRELAAAGLDAAWLRGIPEATRRIDDELRLPELSKLARLLADDLQTMARPVLETTAAGEEPHGRVAHWLAWLAALAPDRLEERQLDALTRGRRDAGHDDSLHQLVMDLHKRINRLAGELASEVIDGASAWELQLADRLRVAAFMRGLNRTAPLKFDRPGLDTAATRDGERLLIQNDIGTNDAHVLVLQVPSELIAAGGMARRERNFAALTRPAGDEVEGPLLGHVGRERRRCERRRRCRESKGWRFHAGTSSDEARQSSNGSLSVGHPTA